MNLDDSSLPPDEPWFLNPGTPSAAGRQQRQAGRMNKAAEKAPTTTAPAKYKAPTTSARQTAAARKNLKKAATAAKQKRTLAKLPKKTRTALGKEGARAARKKRG
ncbi:hypothetical protein [Prosthecobacter sp.]|uniref:hypothetical protein n=1 Tax=Prosthecobacter sp. TaxID=1965333 RepID=UPI003784B984